MKTTKINIEASRPWNRSRTRRKHRVNLVAEMIKIAAGAVVGLIIGHWVLVVLADGRRAGIRLTIPEGPPPRPRR